MSAKASDLAARMQATATHTSPPRPSLVPSPPPAVVAAVPDVQPARSRAETPARFTVELPRTQHRFVKRFALDADTDASTVTRALLNLLETDHQVAERIRAMVER
jgi:hypothetical protein